MPNPLRVAVYHRVSTTFDQDPTLAREELRAAAKRIGGAVALDVEETGSGARNDRPGLQRLMLAARKRQIDAVLVWKLDRFGRSALDVLANIRELDSAGVRFMATSQGLDVRPGSDAMSRLILGVLASVAEFERDIIRERTRLGLERARASGKRLGRPMVLSEARAERVKKLRAAGKSWAQTAAAVGCKVGAARLAAAR
jgi:putative DNA-invertase from lambdoid prophage Rac